MASLSLMRTCTAIPYERHLTALEASRFRRVVIPDDEDDRWFVFATDDGAVHMHRTWTGFHIFEAHLRDTPDGGADLVDVFANNDPKQRAHDDPDELVKHLDWLVGFLLASPPA